MAIKLPQILNVPPKLLPLIDDFDKYRYFLIEGGRDSGKTQTIARFISYLCEKKQLRVVCGRETQNSIEESVYTVFADLIRSYELNYSVGASKIDHKVTGSAIRFRGFREQGATNIKGLEGIDILWVDESQAISKQTLDIIIPTIRKENAKVIWTMNRYVDQDPVYVAMVGREDCLHIHIDYHENPFCSEAMKREALQCKEKSPEDYEHIWLGKPLPKADNALYSAEEVYNSPKIEFLTPGARKRILAVDVARFGEDETVFSIIESYNVNQWQHIFQDTWKNKSLTECVGKIVELSRTWGLDQIVIDDSGVGGGVTDMLNEMNLPVMAFIGAGKPQNETYSNIRSEAFFNLKDMFARREIKIQNDPKLQEQLLAIRYKYMSVGGKKAIVGKDEMRKLGLKSPDRADALAQAIYFRANTLDIRDTRESYMPSDYKMEESFA